MELGLIDDFKEISYFEKIGDICFKRITEERYFQALFVLDKLSNIHDEYGVAFENEDLRIFSPNAKPGRYNVIEIRSNNSNNNFVPFVWQLFHEASEELGVSNLEEYYDKMSKMDKRLNSPKEQVWQQSLEKLYNIAKLRAMNFESEPERTNNMIKTILFKNSYTSDRGNQEINFDHDGWDIELEHNYKLNVDGLQLSYMAHAVDAWEWPKPPLNFTDVYIQVVDLASNKVLYRFIPDDIPSRYNRNDIYGFFKNSIIIHGDWEQKLERIYKECVSEDLEKILESSKHGSKTITK